MTDRGVLLVTGGAGRIARATAGGLTAVGWTLRLIDTVEMSTQYELARADITDRATLRRAMAGADAVLHLAGIPTETSWAETVHTNIDGTQAVLDAARSTTTATGRTSSASASAASARCRTTARR